MTVCVAAICDRGKGIVLASDKMIGTASIEAELDIEKTFQIHPRWRVLFAGNDIAPIPDILRAAKDRLPPSDVWLQHVADALVLSYREKRLRDAEAKYLSPLDLTFKQFVDAGEQYRKIFGQDTYIRLLTNIHSHELDIELLVAGFDTANNARLFSIDSGDRGIPQHHDEIPGFHAIGSGGIAANHMMYYRGLSPRVPTRLAALLAYEAKYFGESASGVGIRTDLYVWPAGQEPRKVDETFIEDVLVKRFVKKLQPQEVTRRHLDALNTLDGFGDIPKVRVPKRDKKADEYKDLITRVGDDE